MTRRITCYVVFATLIWSAHTQNEEKDRADMFKSNMTRNDFSKLLSSLIKLNEQRVNVLQRLYKLEDYGVLSEVLRSGDKKPENGSPNNLFLIVMSKNETAPSRRKLDFEIVDTVKSLDVGSKKVHPKLDYVLDPAGYISQKTNKKTSIESIFRNIPIVHEPKKTHLINDGSKKNINTMKPPKYRNPRQNTKELYRNILRSKKTGLKANKEMKNRYENSKFEILRSEGNGNISQELQDYDENSKKYSPVDYDDPPHYPEIYVTKIIETKKSNNNNYTYPLKAKDPQGGNEYGSPFSKEFTNKSPNGQDAKTGISILNNQDSKYTLMKTDIKSTTNKNDLRITSIVNSNKTDTLSNSQNEKNHFEHKDEYKYASPFSRDFDDPNRKYTKMYSDISIKKVNDDKNPKPNTNTDSPKISVPGNQSPQFNRSKSMLNPINNYSTVMTEISATTNKNDLRIISTLNNSKTNTLQNDNKNSTFYLQHKDQEDENYYGSLFSKEYDEVSQYIKTESEKIKDKQYLKLNQSKSIINNEKLPYVLTYSTNKTVIATSDAKNGIPLFNTSNGNKATENNYSEKSNLNIDLEKSKIKDENASKVNDHSDKFSSQATKNPSASEISVTTKVLPYKNDTKKYNPKIANDLLDSVNFGEKESKNNTNRDSKKNLSRVMVIENIDGLTITTDSSLHLKDVTENTNKDKMKTAKDLDNGNKKKVKTKQHKDDGKKKFGERGELIIDKKDGEDFSIVVTHVRKDKPEEIKQPTNIRIDSKEINRPDGKPIERKAFQKCLNKKGKKLCSKSCISAYKNVCQRLKCTSRAKKALKKECKRRCQKTFASASSKHSDESNSDDSSSNEDSDYS